MAKRQNKIVEEEQNVQKLFDNLKQKYLCLAFGKSRQAVLQWLKDGCPQNENKLYSLRDVIQWRENKLNSGVEVGEVGEKKKLADLEKVQKSTEKLELEIANMQKKTMPRERVEELFKAAETNLTLFLVDGYKRNGQELMYKIKECRELKGFYVIMDEFFKEAMDNFLKSGEEI